jgi:hypothetical protein
VASVMGGAGEGAREKVIGMYIHQHWPYRHPYAARTWTLEDYHGYAGALKLLGVNTLVIWPLLETMPDPLTSSDRANLEKMSRVIDMLHDQLGMRVMITLCPNIVANNAEAAKAPFEKRHFFYTNRFVDPGDSAAMARMMAWREKLLRPLAKADGLVIIDSDPGGYPGSTNSQFVNLLVEHRKVLDRLRPGIELYYWMHVGWQAYGRYYQTGKFQWGTPEESVDILTKLKKADPRPWGITIHTMDLPPNGTDLHLAEKFGVAANSLSFNYGAIEAEPSFPMTNFGGDGAYNAGRPSAPGGVVGNAQTHCVQLPNTFAFFRGATGQSAPTRQDYTQFANELIDGKGELIVAAWHALAGEDARPMREAAGKLETAAAGTLSPGRLKGLLFGDARRFMTDLVMELRMKAAFTDFVVATKANQGVKGKFRAFAASAATWQSQHGYECAWDWPGLTDSLRKLRSPQIDQVLDEEAHGATPAAEIEDHFRITETYTSRLIAAMQKTAATV